MKREQSGFEKLLRGLILLTGFYIIYRGSGILAETGWLRRIFTPEQTAAVMQEAAVTAYLPGYSALLEQKMGSRAAGQWMNEFFPVLHSWYAQAELQDDFDREETGEEETQSRETEEETGEAESNPQESEDKESELESELQESAESDPAKAPEADTEGPENSVPEDSETESQETETPANEALSGRVNVEIPGQLNDFHYLLNHYFVVDADTVTDAEQLDAGTLLSEDLSIEKKAEPQILIYHTHSQEAFADSTEGDEETGIIGIGTYLAELLEERYGYQVIHDKGVYDLVDGVLDRSAAYDYARMSVERILEDYPSIEVVIDLHRDGVEDYHFVAEENGKPTAQIMFFNGLSKNSAGQNIGYLYNPYIQENLSFSFQLQMAAEKTYPGYTRNIYLKGQRFNLHLRPRSLLVEAGTQMNTIEEEKNAMEPLADILNQVLSGENRESSG